MSGSAATRAVFGNGLPVLGVSQLLLAQQERLASTASLTVQDAVGHDEPMVAPGVAETVAQNDKSAHDRRSPDAKSARGITKRSS